MKGSRTFAVLIMIGALSLPFVYSIGSAYGHPIGRSLQGLPVRIDNEQFSEQTVSTDGGVITITGTLVSLTTERIEMSPHISVTPSGFVDAAGDHNSSVPPYDDLLRPIYPPYRDQSGWYFRTEHSLPSSFVLKPDERIDYEVRVYPLKAGVYHVHSFFLTENFPRLGIGQTVIVTGSSAPTPGEITQLYLPFILGAASFAALSWRVLRISKQMSSKSDLLARVYFAAKSSFEAVWLAGVLFWLTMWAAYLYPIEARLAYALSASVALAFIVIAGYASSLARSRIRQYALGAGTSAATAAFYFATNSDVITYSVYQEPVFDFGFFSFAIIIGNALIAIYFGFLTRREKNRTARVASLHP